MNFLKNLDFLTSTGLGTGGASLAAKIINNTSATNSISQIISKELNYTPHNSNFDNELKKGNILRVSRGLYWHYGVYSGDDHVIHFTSEENDTSTNNLIIETNTSKFIRDALEIEVLSFPKKVKENDVFSMDETCSRAKSQIGRGDYSLSNNNCQHFALWCKTGLAFSGQTYLLNGGESEEYSNATLINTNKYAAAIAPDFLGIHGISISRTILTSNYIPL